MNLLSYAAQETWCASQQWLESILLAWSISDVTIAASARRMPRPRASGNVAIIPLHGPITQRGSIWNELLGGTSAQAFEAAFSRAIASDNVSAVVLDVDSPGGTVGGIQAAADRVFNARGTKPVIAVANSQMASAAYWIGSQANNVVAAPGADVGSIGVFRIHHDVSEALARDGIKTTMIGVPEHKTESSPFAPLSDEARSHHLEQVQEKFAAFNQAVARARGVTEKHALASFGRGRDFSANKAKELGLVDKVATMSDVLSGLGVGGAVGVTEASAAIAAELCATWDLGMNTERKRASVDIRKRRLELLDKTSKVRIV